MSEQIKSWIDEHQRGKGGIYPYQVALKVCGEFGIGIKEALEYVVDHVKKVMQKTS